MFPEIHLRVFRAVAFIFGNDLCGKNCCLPVGFLPLFRRLYRKYGVMDKINGFSEDLFANGQK